MAKIVQNLQDWGYAVDTDAESFEITVPSDGRHCHVYHPLPSGEKPLIPTTTFTVTEDKGLLKIPRAFNDSDHRPKSEKLKLRDQIVSFWSLVEDRPLKELRKICYTDVVEDNLVERIEEVYDMMGREEDEELTVSRTDPAFQLLITTTPFLAGAKKMLDEYADKFGGKKIESVHFKPLGGFELFDFTINFT
ncbi:hypothetical protein diail_6869 [Diaporthe ilicicola]|nr:hypothetical protein diail_6869 [Diaporthe ilicicola]